MNIALYARKTPSARTFGRVVLEASEARTLGAASLLVAVTALALWLAGGVHLDEIARYVLYELGFVFLPGWLVYRALVARPAGRLHEIVFGWSLGYLLEILAFFVTAHSQMRGLLYVYPLVVGFPAALVGWKRRVAARQLQSATGRLPSKSVWIGALLCVLLLLYAGAVGFTQTPLPRDTGSVTYQEDTVFTISLAAEALHHWPMTLPMVAGEPLHYHLFAFMHFAAIRQVTGIDLSVVVMRLYEVPLLLLFALQLFLAGRRVGGAVSVGLVALFVVLFLGELDTSIGTGLGRFLFRDLFFFWLLGSHTFLLGLVFFLPAVLILCDLLSGREALRRSQAAGWILLTAYLIGCVGSKSYSLFVLGGALVLFLLWKLWRHRMIHRPALLALGVTAAVHVAANILVFGWNSAGVELHPLRNIKTTGGVQELDTYLGDLWGTVDLPNWLGVPYGTFGLLGVSIVGIALLLRYKRFDLSTEEMLFLSLFVAVLPALFLSGQPGFGQMFLVFFGVLPGTILAAGGYRQFWLRDAPESLRAAAFVLVAVAASILALDLASHASPRVGLLVTLFVVVVATGIGKGAGLLSSRLVLPVALGVGIVGLLIAATPLVRLLRAAFGHDLRGSPGTDAIAIAFVLGVAGLAVGTLLVVRRPSARRGVAAATVAGTLLTGVLNTPLDWFPHLVGRLIDGRPVYNQEYNGLTAGLHEGLRWIRDNTGPDAVLAVNNHSLQPDGSDSKYFYYSAFAERRVVLESWDYTEQAARTGFFTLPAELTPFPRQLALSDALFDNGNEEAARVLVRHYGASHLVVDKVHGDASPEFSRLFPKMFSNDDIDVYAVGRPGNWLCNSEQGTGIAAVFGHRSTTAAAERLRQAAERVGFSGLVIQRRGCFDYAVVLTGLESLTQAREFRQEAATVSFDVELECRTRGHTGEINAVFGHRRTKKAAEEFAARLRGLGYEGLVLQRIGCGAEWEVIVPDLETAAQRREFRLQAAAVGLDVTFEPG